MLTKLCNYLTPPPIYTVNEQSFWQDDYISSHLLQAHLNPEFEGASRSHTFIDNSVNWIEGMFPSTQYRRLLDIGCGPGLYAERLVAKGYKVTGVDFSKRSIDYARNSADKLGCSIEYRYENYLTDEWKDPYDIAVLIYCDYAALSTNNRKLLLDKIYAGLCEGGVLLLDVFTRHKFDAFQESRTWSIHEKGGFWNEGKHISLHLNLKYPEYTTLEQTAVMTEEDTKVYYIWNRYFTREELIAEASEAEFTVIGMYQDVEGKPYSEDGMTMCMTLQKNSKIMSK